MSRDKRRILFCGEFSQLSTGFAVFNREILRRLHATGRYELAEMASFARQDDARAKDLPWKFYGVLPMTQVEQAIYDPEKNPTNPFGKYKIDAVLADFQPDIVFDCRDPWMVDHLISAKFRNNYKLVLTPTVDSAPQKNEWVANIYKKADVVTTYSRFGKRTLEKQGVKVAGITSPGCDLDIFKPLDKETVRDKFHLNKSLLVFGTVMRNQRRKLFPELFDAYAKLRNKHAQYSRIERIKTKIKKGGKLSRAEKDSLVIAHSTLLCHTSWPDRQGWDLPDYLYNRYSLQRHVIFTYKCDECSSVYVSWFTPTNPAGLCICRNCGKQAAHMPNTHSGITEEQLVEIFNLMDIYMQPAICEGWGLPIMESKACGVPGLYQNYSAMEDHVENGGGLGINVDRMYHEAETAAMRSLPSVDDMVKKMETLALNKSVREKLANEARTCALRMHSWDNAVNKFMEIFDSLEVSNRAETWDLPINLTYVTSSRPPANLDNPSFINWLYINILHRAPDEKGFNDWMANLAKGASRDEIEKYFRQLVQAQNSFEEVRWVNSLRNRGVEDLNKYETCDEVKAPGVLV